MQERIVRVQCTGYIKKTLQLSEKGMDGNTRLAKECSQHRCRDGSREAMLAGLLRHLRESEATLTRYDKQ